MQNDSAGQSQTARRPGRLGVLLGRPIGRPDQKPPDYVRKAHAVLPGATEKIRAEARMCGHAHRRAGVATSQTRRRGNRRGHYRGPLHGIPYGAKDLLAAKGLPTTWGCAPYTNQFFDSDATLIQR